MEEERSARPMSGRDVAFGGEDSDAPVHHEPAAMISCTSPTASITRIDALQGHEAPHGVLRDTPSEYTDDEDSGQPLIPAYLGSAAASSIQLKMEAVTELAPAPRR